MYKDDTIHYPQDEMATALLMVTSGCLYNRCVFCSMYKDIKYHQVSFFDIERELLNMYKYTEKVFLTGADPLSIGFENMNRLLKLIRKYLPYCACVASYASINSISSYSVEELSILHDLGLRLLYIGFETGRDDILKLMKKSHTLDRAVEQARKLNRANIQFNSIIIYGIAGMGQGVDNAIMTANMFNQFITKSIITMSLTVFNGTELNNMVNRGEFKPADRKERLIEIRGLIENIKPIKALVFDTSHPTNIVRIKGILPNEKASLINRINDYINVLT